MKKVLQITAHFTPNIGGVETHLNDLIAALTKRGWKVFILTYKPLTTKTKWKIYEGSQGISVLRIPWIAGLFYKFVPYAGLEFLYLLPGLFILTPFVLLIKNPSVIHAQGLVAGFVGVFWGKIFKKRVVVSTHSIYHFPKTGFYPSFVRWIFNNADFCLGLSKPAAEEITSLKIPKNKVGIFTYWVDLKKFKRINNAKRKLGWNRNFIILFVGRLIAEKGVFQLLEAAKMWNRNITLVIIGSGPLEEKINKELSTISHLIFLGRVENEKLPLFYSAADLLIVPSTHEEGFGRVILESLACGTPVIGARRGAIPEAMNESVGKFIDVTPENVKKAVEYFFKNSKELEKLSKNARKFAEQHYSGKNVEKIIQAYQG